MLSNGDAEKIQELRDRGFSVSKIARETGCDRKTVRKHMGEDGSIEQEHHPVINKPHPESRESQHPFIPKKIPADQPSQRIRDRRDDAEIVSLEIERQKGLRELEKVIGSQISPELQKKKDNLEIKKISLEEFEVEERLKERQQIEEAQRREEKIKTIIQEVKERVLPFKMRVALPAAIIFTIYQRIETELLKFDILNLSYSEVVLIADSILTECVNDPQLQPIIQDSFSEFFFREAKKQVNIAMKKTHEDYIKKGGILDYRNFILSLVSRYPPEKQSRILEVIDVR